MALIPQLNGFSYASFDIGFMIPGVSSYYVAKPCSVDEECSDGVYCNGVELCRNSFCINGSPPCVTSDCATCSESEQQCQYVKTGTACGLCGSCNATGDCNSPATCPAKKSGVSVQNILIAFGTVVGSLSIFFGIVATILILRTRKLRKYQQLSTIEANYPQVYDVEVAERIAGGEFGDVYRGFMDVSDAIVVYSNCCKGNRGSCIKDIKERRIDRGISTRSSIVEVIKKFDFG